MTIKKEVSTYLFTLRGTQVITHTLFYSHMMHTFAYTSGKGQKHEFFENGKWMAKMTLWKNGIENPNRKSGKTLETVGQ